MTHTLEQLRTGKLTGIHRLKLACGLTEFPHEIFDLADSLEILDLSGNAMTSLPDDLPRLHKLRVIFCSDNQFTELPEILGQCPKLSMIGFKANRIREVPAGALPVNLRWLILTGNRIETLPEKIGKCRQLQKLALAGNRLLALPKALAACDRLELLRISANRLSEFPDWLLAMPRLSWLAYAGNPFCEKQELAVMETGQIRSVSWDALEIQSRLGEGASGIIHEAKFRDGNGSRSIAVKLFKGALTSDGFPHSEMAACISAGEHPNLIPALGKLRDHPKNVDGLLMPLIDPEFRNLAGPPSLGSCTRDIYATGQSFDLGQILGIAQGIASAARHLHHRGIMHGDLYGHNILHSGRGRALLGDYGAASLFAPGTLRAQALQRIEVCAFGYLLEELIERYDTAPAFQATVESIVERLAGLKKACLNDEIAGRPLFEEIERVLSDLKQMYQGTVNRQ